MLHREQAPLLELLPQVLLADSVSPKAFYSHKVCTSRAETQMCSKTSGDTTSEGAQMIVNPSASNPTLEFRLYLCVRAAPG